MINIFISCQPSRSAETIPSHNLTPQPQLQCTSFNYQQKFPLSGYAKFKEANHNLEDPPCRLGTSNEALAHRPNLTPCHPGYKQ